MSRVTSSARDRIVYAPAMPRPRQAASGVVVNDVHSRLNGTRVAEVVRPRDVAGVAAAIHAARGRGQAVSIAGGRHAMGGQQFAEGACLLDMRDLSRVAGFDAGRGVIRVEGGIEWPALVGFLATAQHGRDAAWGIVQKQTGADNLTLGGALACNAHGRGLTLRPIVDQVESFDLVGPDGVVRHCSRQSHAELFGLAIGGYGLFGVIAGIDLRLRRRVKLRRVVEIVRADDLMPHFDDRIRDGCLYGDFQFAIDPRTDDFLRTGVCACYEPVAADEPLTADPIRFSAGDWTRLTCWAHSEKRRAFEFYASRYLETSGQVYWSDAQLAASYVEDYHLEVDRALACHPGSEMITELYVPRPRLAAWLADARRLLRELRADVIYGTIRLIERDDETVLAWARERWACVVLNLHVEHTAPGLARARETFRALIDLAIAHDGSYYLTYHRWATPEQLQRCYPRFDAFAAAKRRIDPGGVFQSNWWRDVSAR
jgi:FAD/FMN-containing dehydrogenase